MKKCKVQGCERIVKARGMCNPHYVRQMNYGSPFGGNPKLHRDRKPEEKQNEDLQRATMFRACGCTRVVPKLHRDRKPEEKPYEKGRKNE